jgi:polygalacturonase
LKAINDAIAAAAAAGGGTVVVPAGDFRTCTIRLTSRVGLHFATRHSIVRAAVHGPAPQGDGGSMTRPSRISSSASRITATATGANSLIFGVVATDRDGPTARIKLGTEGTTGFSRITIRNVTFDRSRGFALESVDGAELADIVLSDATMKHVSSSPIFIRLVTSTRRSVPRPRRPEALARSAPQRT